VDSDEARSVFVAERRAVLGTADGGGVPHLVPVTFVVLGDHVYVAIDHKPKRTTDLKRLRNIAANPNVSLLVDRYADDWSRLWWARADGTATVRTFPDLRDDLLSTFQAKYPQYAETPPGGQVVDVAVTRWSGWRMVTKTSRSPRP
jgi:PPOX class probable F420-dependent enzyme